ncbi:MAG: cysteine desulfurase [Rhodothermales bacterium]|nr:cysteine desulfurase [Rhodothermales bacterium]MBO6781543.1 cysteine desulfurase [Rhodothermales bacterium]
MTPVYLDYAATSPIPEAVLQAMLPWLTEGFGNPSSVHGAGRVARNAVEEARESIARQLGCSSEEVIFTSGGTESNHLAIAGWEGGIVTCEAEHEAVLKPAESRGARILRADASARVSAADVRPFLDAGTLVSVMAVNNELGTVNPIRDIADACHEAGAFLHTDAVQAAVIDTPHIPSLGVDMMTLSGHKVGAPKGVGLLYVRKGVPWSALMRGGGQERDRRGGTENVAGIVAMAAALARARRADLPELNRRLREGLIATLGDHIRINTPEAGSSPHILQIGVPDVPAGEGSELLILGLDLEGIQVSAGSACSSGTLNASHVMAAIGQAGIASIRYSMGHATTEADVDRAVSATRKVISRTLAAL